MSNKYKEEKEVPNDVIVSRLRELSTAVVKRDMREFSMRIPTELDRDADCVLSIAAARIARLEAENKAYDLRMDNDAQTIAELQAGPPPEGFPSWEDASVSPAPSKPGVKADAYLCITTYSDEPKVLTYIYENEQWTSGGGDTQKVRWWKRIVLPAALAAAMKEAGR